LSGAEETRAALRRRLRRLRRSIPAVERAAAEQAIRRELRRLGVWQRGRRIAAYVAMPGEVDLAGALTDGLQRGAHIYVPRIASRRAASLDFVPLTRRAVLRRNAFGILEPAGAGRLPVRSLDVVLVPLVGFDARGRRLGMGAGYYDRALWHRSAMHRGWRRPLLVGIAHSIQQVEHLEQQPWDVPLDLVVTERGVLRCLHEDPDA
jgi:5-formyltetrahydrofolate cyclo-ligase